MILSANKNASILCFKVNADAMHAAAKLFEIGSSFGESALTLILKFLSQSRVASWELNLARSRQFCEYISNQGFLEVP